MDYLTVREVAELKGCSMQILQKHIKEGKIFAERKPHPQNKQPCYMIPVSALPEDLQAKYYAKLKADAGLAPELKNSSETVLKQRSKRVQRTFEELSEAERTKYNFWCRLLEEWQARRSQYRSKTDFDKNFVGECRLKYEDIEISTDILYRKWTAYKNNDIESLLGSRGAWNRGKSTIPEPVWNAFLWYWLDENKPTVSLCYRSSIKWTTEFYPEFLEHFPSERAFRRQIDRDVSYALKTLMRDGKKAFDDRCSPYIMRMYDKLEANDCWIADNHTLDIISLDGTLKHRLYLTAFLDAKSGVLTGWNITDSPDSQSTVLALRHGIMRFGIPKEIYVDNGREFLTFDLGGKGHRTRKSDKNKADPTTILERLGIKMHNAIVCNAKAKPIERTFYTVKSQFSKLWDGFCGGTILERPESLKRRIKNSDIPCDYDVRRVLSAWIDNEYNQQPYGGSECCFKNMSRKEVWEATIMEIRETTPDMLNLLMMRSTRPQQIKRNGVYVKIAGEPVWFMHEEQTINNLEKEVFVRYDPADLRTVRIYNAEDDSFLFEWQNASSLMVDFITEVQEDIADAQEKIRSAKKFVKEQAKGIADNLSQEQRISMLDMMIKSAENWEEFEIRKPKRIIPMIANEEPAGLKKAVGAEDYNDYYSELEELRAMNDRLEKAKKGV